MLENTATQGFKINYAVRFEKQLQATKADEYGGNAENWPGEGDGLKLAADFLPQTGREYVVDASANGTQFNGKKQISAALPVLSGMSIFGWTQGIERILLAGIGYASVAGPVPDSRSPGYWRHFFAIPPQGKNQRKYTQEERDSVGNSYSDEDFINLYVQFRHKNK
jgi:hypothetical protein